MSSTLWQATEIKKKINNSIDALAEVGAPTSWVFNNHDVVRSVDRLDLGLTNSGDTTLLRQGDPKKLNIARGTLRARSATLMALALPGGTYLYQGEELAVPEVRDIPEDRLTDPRWKMSGFQDRGRDGCRVPLPWSSEPKGAFGFSTNDALKPDEAWLPQSPWWGKYSVASQDGVAGSTLSCTARHLQFANKSQVLVMAQWNGSKPVPMLLPLNVPEILLATLILAQQLNFQATAKYWCQVAQ